MKFSASARKAIAQGQKNWCLQQCTLGIRIFLSIAYCILHSRFPLSALRAAVLWLGVKAIAQAHELATGKSFLLASIHSNQTDCFWKGQVHSSHISAQWCVIIFLYTPQPNILGWFLFQRCIAAVSLWWVM